MVESSSNHWIGVIFDFDSESNTLRPVNPSVEYLLKEIKELKEKRGKSIKALASAIAGLSAFGAIIGASCAIAVPACVLDGEYQRAFISLSILALMGIGGLWLRRLIFTMYAVNCSFTDLLDGCWTSSVQHQDRVVSSSRNGRFSGTATSDILREQSDLIRQLCR